MVSQEEEVKADRGKGAISERFIALYVSTGFLVPIQGVKTSLLLIMATVRVQENAASVANQNIATGKMSQAVSPFHLSYVY